MTANKTMDSTKVGLSKASFFYLLVAGLVDLGVAFMPAWSLTAESNPFVHAIQSFGAVVQETANQPRELIAIFWLPFGVGMVCLGAALAAPFGSSNVRAIIFTPVVITVAALLYFFVAQADIHIMAISLLPLSVAWWEYRKSIKQA